MPMDRKLNKAIREQTAFELKNIYGIDNISIRDTSMVINTTQLIHYQTTKKITKFQISFEGFLTRFATKQFTAERFHCNRSQI